MMICYIFYSLTLENPSIHFLSVNDLDWMNDEKLKGSRTFGQDESIWKQQAMAIWEGWT
jgi:hypothetical protein